MNVDTLPIAILGIPLVAVCTFLIKSPDIWIQGLAGSWRDEVDDGDKKETLQSRASDFGEIQILDS